MTTDRSPALVVSSDGTVSTTGVWTADGLVRAYPKIDEKAFDRAKTVRIDLSGLTELDTFGAAALTGLLENLHKAGLSTEIFGAESRYMHLIDSLSKKMEPKNSRAAGAVSNPIEAIGKAVVDAGSDTKDIAEVQGHIIWSAFDIITLRGPVKIAAITNQFYDIVLKAIPIVALITFVVGIILTQQSIAQLRDFGATIFVVDLGGVLMLREVGILLAAIMVAGRSGSAITAEIGSMKMREEIDALEVMGLDTYRAVIMPRALALLAGMPALGLIGSISGIVGAALVARFTGGISFENFITRLNNAIDLHTMWVGVVKAPFMALVIAVIAASEGLKVAGSTQSLGRHTTASVVKSIFAVIVLDGLFAIFFEAIGF